MKRTSDDWGRLMPNRIHTAVAGLAGLAGVGAIGVLAGCAPASTVVEPGPAPTTVTVPGASTAPETTAPADTTAPGGASSPYADGVYGATGSYLAPSGQEQVTVTVSLEDGVVTGVEVVGGATNRDAQNFQGQFAAGIADVVVGQPIEGLRVDRVAGSSLTGGGFNQALDAIRSQALG